MRVLNLLGETREQQDANEEIEVRRGKSRGGRTRKSNKVDYEREEQRRTEQRRATRRVPPLAAKGAGTQSSEVVSLLDLFSPFLLVERKVTTKELASCAYRLYYFSSSSS